MLKVSCVQMKPELGQFETNLSKMEDYIKSIMADRPETKLIVFPELITSGYELTKEEFEKIAEDPEDCQSVKRIGALCKEHGVNVVYGFPEKSTSDGVMYNSAICLRSDASIAGVYRKAHPFDTEKKWCKEGSEIVPFETEFGKVGIMICWDTAFPEVALSYGLQGADLLIVSTNWEKPYSDDWDLITSARAFDNTLHLVAANRIGDDKELGFFGHSKILSPIGKTIAALDEEIEGVVYAEIDLDRTKTLREEYYTMFADRQPNLFGAITEPKK